MEAQSRLQKAIERAGETCLHLFCRFAYKGDFNTCMEPGGQTDIPIPEMDPAPALLMGRLWEVIGSPWTPWICLAVFLVGHEVWRLRRVRREAKASRINSWFPHNLPRQVYCSVLCLQIRDASESPKKERQSIHNAALLRWAVECIRRAMQLKQQTEACNKLTLAGSVGRDLLEWLVVAEKEVEVDMRNIMALAMQFDPDFGVTIMPLAFNIMEREDFDKKLAVIEKKREEEKEWWEARRQMILRELVREFGEEDLGVPQKLLAMTGAEGNGNGSGNPKTRKRKGSKTKAKGKGKK